MAPTMPCKRRNKESFWQRERQLVASPKGLRTRYGCIVESDESTRLRAEISQPKHHEDHIAGRGYTSMNHYNLVHKFIPMPKASKIPDAKAAVDSQRETGSQGVSTTGGGGLVRVPNLRVCEHLGCLGGTRRGRRANLRPAVVPSSRRGKVPPVRRTEGRPGCPWGQVARHVARVTTVPTHPCPNSGRRGCARRQGWWKRSKFRERGLHALDKTVGSRTWWHIQGLSELMLDLGWRSRG